MRNPGELTNLFGNILPMAELIGDSFLLCPFLFSFAGEPEYDGIIDILA